MSNKEQTLKHFLANKKNPNHKILNQFAEYLREQPSKRSIKRSFSTDYNIITAVDNFLTFSKKEYSEITIIDIENFLENFQAKSAMAGRIKYFIMFLYENSLLKEESYKKIINKKYKNNNIKNKKFAIPFEHWKVIANQLSGVRKFSVMLMFFSGIRVGELINLAINDLKFDEKLDRYKLYIQPKKDEKGKIIWYPKTDKSIREIPLDPSCNSWIDQYLAIREKQDLLHNYLLYTTKSNAKAERGEKINYESNVNVWLKKIYYDTPNESFKECKEIISRTTIKDPENPKKRIIKNIYCTYTKPHRHISPHVTRYSYASHIYYSGRDNGFDVLDEVSKLLGHTDSKTTSVYLQLDKVNEEKRKLKALDNAFGG